MSECEPTVARHPAFNLLRRTQVSNTRPLRPRPSSGDASFCIPALQQRLLLDLAPLPSSGHSTVSYELCFPPRVRPCPTVSSLLLLLPCCEHWMTVERGAKKRGSYDIKGASRAALLLSSVCQTTLPPSPKKNEEVGACDDSGTGSRPESTLFS